MKKLFATQRKSTTVSKMSKKLANVLKNSQLTATKLSDFPEVDHEIKYADLAINWESYKTVNSGKEKYDEVSATAEVRDVLAKVFADYMGRDQSKLVDVHTQHLFNSVPFGETDIVTGETDIVIVTEVPSNVIPPTTPCSF